MSSAIKEEDEVMFCASCGTAGDDIKLKRCTACYLVKYCSVKCQKDHRPQHEEECKKRAAELRDEILFKQPDGIHYGDCPICCLPLPTDPLQSTLYPCCCKRICNGCSVTNQMREKEGKLQQKCPFCRKAASKTDEEINEFLMKRIEANDPVAMWQMGMDRFNKGDYNSSFEYAARAAALGEIEAHYHLSILYYNGLGVEKDEKKELHHVEQAAIAGHPGARHNLGCMERENGRMDRAVKHFIIASKLGYDDSLENVKKLYKSGHISKEDLDAALRGHKAAIDATESPQREDAVEFWEERERMGI